jgi:hypothetical protein
MENYVPDNFHDVPNISNSLGHNFNSDIEAISPAEKSNNSATERLFQNLTYLTFCYLKNNR